MTHCIYNPLDCLVSDVHVGDKIRNPYSTALFDRWSKVTKITIHDKNNTTLETSSHVATKQPNETIQILRCGD